MYVCSKSVIHIVAISGILQIRRQNGISNIEDIAKHITSPSPPTPLSKLSLHKREEIEHNIKNKHKTQPFLCSLLFKFYDDTCIW